MKTTGKAAAMLLACALLCGCGQSGAANEGYADETSGITVTSDSAVSSTKETAADSALADVRETVREDVDNEDIPDDDTFTDYDPIDPEDQKLLDAVRNGSALVMYPDGRIDVSGAEVVEKLYNVNYYRHLLSDEVVGMMSEDMGFSSKEEYLDGIMEEYPEISDMTDSEGNITVEAEPAVYISVPGGGGYYNTAVGGGSNAEAAFYRTGQWVLSTIREDREIIDFLMKEMEEKGYVLAEVRYSWDGRGVISASLKSFDNGAERVQTTEKFHISGKPGIMIGENFLFSDTKKLAVTNNYELVYAAAAGEFTSDDCVLICYDDDYYREVGTLDLEEVARKLPRLTELYMYQVEIVNEQALSDMVNLEKLLYYSSGENVPPFAKLKNLRELYLFGIYDDYSFLNEMTRPEKIHINYSYGDRGLAPILECTGITSLEICGSGYIDCTGIDKMTALKRLEIRCSDIDFAPISRIPELEYLFIESDSGENLRELANAAKLKTLFIINLEVRDWRFLAQMPALEELTLYYVPNVKNDHIRPLKNLKRLSLCNSGCNIYAVDELENLERLDYDFYIRSQDFSKLSACKNLRELHISACEGTLNCEALTGLPLEILYCKSVDVENVESLSEINCLRRIDIAVREGDPGWADILREALPDCNVKVEIYE